MKAIKHIQRKIERRGRGHAEIMKNLRLKNKSTPPTAYKAPGAVTQRSKVNYEIWMAG